MFDAANLNINDAPTVDKRMKLTFKDFENEYLKKNKPVVITDAISDWDALGKWTPEYFKNNYSDMDIDLDGLKMGEFIDMVTDKNRSESELPYLRNKQLYDYFPELMADVLPMPVFMRPNWFNNKLIPGRIRNRRTDLFIGGPGSKFPYVHWDNYHGYAWLFQIYGEKEYIVFPPEQSEYMYARTNLKGIANQSTIEDIENPDYEKYPLFKKTTPIRIVLKAGEMMFMAAGWWHTARMLSPSITVSSNTANQYNWPMLTKDHLKLLPTKPIKAIGGTAFLYLVRYIESLKDVSYRKRQLYNAQT